MTRRVAVVVLLALATVGCDGGEPADRTARSTGSTRLNDEASRAPVPLTRPRTTSARTRSVAVGERSACAVRSGALYCWGSLLDVPRSASDPPRDFSPTDQPFAPHRVELPGRVREVVIGESASAMHGCVLLEEGEVRCWGRDLSGALGDGACKARRLFVPRPVPLPAVAVEIAALAGRTCARLTDGRVACWGAVLTEPCERVMPGPELVVRADGSPLFGAARIEADLAIDGDGALYAWGDDRVGQISRESDPARRLGPSMTARRVPGLPPAMDVASAGFATCILTRSGSVRCWGDRTWSTSAEAALAERLALEPVPVPGVPASRAIACAIGACLAAGRDGALYRWASGSPDGEVVGSTRRSRELPSLAVSWEGWGGCIFEASTLRCWGSALYGVASDEVIAAGALRDVPLPPP